MFTPASAGTVTEGTPSEISRSGATATDLTMPRKPLKTWQRKHAAARTMRD
jgi:hypothetical protein